MTVGNTLNNFIASQSLMSSTLAFGTAIDSSYVTITSVGIYSFNADPNVNPGTKSRIPLHIRTGQQCEGNPVDRKRYKQIEVHGKGTCHIRVYVDNVYIYESNVTLSETPDKDRRMGIPIGTRGYTIDVELSGDANIRALEYSYEPMQGLS